MRRRVPEVKPGEITVPAELTSPASWLADGRPKPMRRMRTAFEEFIRENGLMDPRWPNFPDHHRTRELGIYDPHGDEMRERLRALEPYE
jgi:hypothetical protein